MQRVEDGEQVHERQLDRPPGEESEAPGEAQQEGEPGHAAQVVQARAVLVVVGVLPLDPLQLHHDHHEHGQVQHKDQAEVRHHAHVEGNIILEPAAGIRGIKYSKSAI